MAEKIKIVELDMDINALTNASTKSQKSLDELKNKVSGLKKSIKENKKEVEDGNATLKRWAETGKTSGKDVDALRLKISQANTELHKNSKSLIENTAQQKTAQSDYNKQIKIIQAHNDKKNQENVIYKQTNGSLKQISSALAINKDRYSNLSKAERDNDKVGGELLRTIQKQDSAYKKLSKSIGNSQANVGNYSEGLKKLYSRFLAFVGITQIFRILRSTKDIVQEFELSVKTLGGVSRATEEELESLKNQAIELGSSTEFTAQQVVELQIEYAKLGFVPKIIEQLAESTLSLSTALGSSLDKTASLVGSTLKIFNKNVIEASSVVDVLALSTQTSALDFEKLNTASPMVGATAKNANISLEEMTATLGVLSDRGVDASTSATSLRNIYLELSKKGLSYNDAMKKINESTDKNKTAFDLFGKRGATVGVILSGLTGEIKNQANVLANSWGSAQDLADKKLKTLDGSFKLLVSAWQGFILQTDESTGVSSIFSKGVKFLADNLQQLIKIALVVVSGFGVYRAGMKLNTIFTKIFKNATGKATISVKALNTAIKNNVFGLIIGLITTAITLYLSFGKSVDEATKKQNEFNKSLDKQSLKFKTFLDIALDESATLEKRQKAYDNIVKGSKGFVKQMDVEKVTRNSVMTQLQEFNKLQTTNNDLSILEERASKLRGKITEAQAKKDEAESLLQNAVAQYSINQYKGQIDFNKELLKNSKNELNEIEKEISNKASQGIDSELQSSLKKLELIEKEKKEKALLIEKEKKALSSFIKSSKVKLDIFIEESKGKAKTLENELKTEEQVNKKKTQILKNRLRVGEITKDQFRLEGLKLDREHAEKVSKITVNYADQELQNYKNNNQSKLEDNTLLTDALVEQEQTRIDLLLEKQLDYEAQRLEQGVISQQDYDIAIADAKVTAIEQQDELDNSYKEQKKEQALVDLEEKRDEDLLNAQNDFEAKLIQLDADRKAELSNTNLTEKRRKLIKQKYAKAEKQIDLEKNNVIMSQTANTLGNIASLLGKNTEVGKATAIAQATITGFQATLNAFNTAQNSPITALFPAYPIVQAGIAGAFAVGQIAQISSTPVPKFEGGGLMEIGGQRHSMGGTKFYGEDGTTFEAERGEYIGVMNRKASSIFMDFNNLYGQKLPSRSNYLENGGIVSRANIPQVNTEPIDYDLLAEKLGNEIQNIPPSKIVIEDFEGQRSDYYKNREYGSN